MLVAQFDRMIDRQIRSLIETQVIHRKLNNMGLKGVFFRVLFLSPTLFIKIHYYYPTKDRLRAQFFRYSKSYSKIYDSYSSVFIQDTYKDDLMLDQADGSEATEERKEDSEPLALPSFKLFLNWSFRDLGYFLLYKLGCKLYS